MGTYFSPGRRVRAISVALAATASLYLMVVFVFEPLRSLAATADTVVQMTVTGTASITCSPTVTLPSAAGTSKMSNTGSVGAGACTVITSNSLGYTLFWQSMQGSGSVIPPCTGRNCYGTGHMLSNNVTAGKPDVILAYKRAGANLNRPWQMDDTTVKAGSGSRWGARLRGNSTTPGGGTVDWSTTDTAQVEGFLPVATGAAVSIARRNTDTSVSGDIESFLYKVFIPDSAFQPTGTYKTTVTFTTADN